MNNQEYTYLLSRYILLHMTDKSLPARKAKIEAFKAIAKSLTGNLKASFYLAGMDCGSGKSTLIKQFLKIWAGLSFKPEGSVLIALPNLEQVERFADECGLSKADYTVYTADSRRNSLGLGRDRASEARVLFTTQQMVTGRMNRTASFEALTEYHYKGKSRPCRIWDESVDVATAIVIPMDHLSSLPSKLRHKHSDAVTLLDGLQAAMINAGAGGEAIVPAAVETAFDRIIATIGHHGLSKEEQDAICDLRALAGLTVGIEKGMKGQLAILGAGRPLPADFLPVIVFDASARVRQTYALQEKHLGNVVRLPCAVHDYQRATFHLWKEPMGTDKLAAPKHRAKILSAIADLINADPESDWLVIHHKAREKRWNVKDELDALLSNRRNAHYIHWGNAAASNDFRNIKKVIVLGTWRKPNWVYVAQAMASSGRGYTDITTDERHVIRLSEHRHDLMQAVGRSNIRNVEEGIAGDVEVYAVMSPEGGIEGSIQETFPGCRIEPWQPVERAPKGQLAALIAYLSSSFSDTVNRIKKADVRAALGIASSQGLAQLVADDRAKSFIARAGIRVQRYAFERLVPA